MKLWLIRHAEAAPGAGRGDSQRPLDLEGEREAARMTDWLARQRHAAEWVWSSEAMRARATADFVARGFAAAAPEVVTDPRLYLANPEQLLAVLRETPADTATAALVGHNPGISQLLHLLAHEPAGPTLPTFGVACLEVGDSWAGLAPGAAACELLASPDDVGPPAPAAP
ncbi:MAG: SixA phosphatase family protein [Pseudomonadota bacterium]